MKVCSISATLVVLLSLAFSVSAAAYSLTDIAIGPDFYDFFDWEVIDDPTHGRVYAEFQSPPF